MPTEAERRYAHAQALANTAIEGHIPTEEFLADCEAVNAGHMTLEQQRARSAVRARALELANTAKGTDRVKAA
jgi:Antitoxin VbhA